MNALQWWIIRKKDERRHLAVIEISFLVKLEMKVTKNKRWGRKQCYVSFQKSLRRNSLLLSIPQMIEK